MHDCVLVSNPSLTYSTIYTGDTGLRGPIGEAGIPGTKGDQGNN